MQMPSSQNQLDEKNLISGATKSTVREAHVTTIGTMRPFTALHCSKKLT
jgi:hypothetical protein